MWLFSGTQKFNTDYVSRNVEISSDCLQATHVVEDDMAGVLFVDPVLAFDGQVSYFEVCIKMVVDTEEDGLTIGVTTQLPTMLPICADDVEPSWSVGFDGRAHIHEIQEMVPIDWNPSTLRRGQTVGFLIAADGAACVLVDGKKKANVPGLVPAGVPLYGVIDLLGNTKSVALVPDAQPPDKFRNFNIQQVRDDVMDKMYAAFGGDDEHLMEDIMLTASLVGIPDRVIFSAKNAMYKGPGTPIAVQSKPKKPKSKWKKMVALPVMGMAKTPSMAQAEEPSDPATKSGMYGQKKEKKSVRRMPSQTKTKGSLKEVSGDALKEPSAGGPNDDDDAPTAASAPPPLAEENGNVAAPKQRKSVRLSRKSRASIRLSTAQLASLDVEADKAEKAKQAAQRAMKNAIASDDINDAKQTVQAAKAAGVDESEIAAAETKIAELETQQKHKSLVKAMDDALISVDAEKIKDAIASAKSGGVDAKELERVQKSLDDLLKDSKKLAQLKALGEAVQTKDIDKVKAAIAAARSGGLSDGDLASYETALKELEVEADRKQKIAAMDDALKARDADKVKSALKDAQHVGVDSASIERVQASLGELLKELEIKKRVDELNDAISSKDLGKVEEALDAARKVGAAEADIARGEKAVQDFKAENRKKEALGNLDLAIQAEDVETLKEAIKEAKAAEVDAIEITRFENSLKRLELEAEKKKVLLELKKAVDSEVIDDIKGALAVAKEVQERAAKNGNEVQKRASMTKIRRSITQMVSAPVEIAQAEKLLKDLEKKREDAKKKLNEAMEAAKKADPPTVYLLKLLKEAEEEAKTYGLDTKEAETVHASLLEALAALKKQAEDDLMAALDSSDPGEINVKLDACLLFGSDDVVDQALEKIAKIVEEAMAVARKAEREQKAELLPPIEGLLNVYRARKPGCPTLRKMHNDMQDLKGALRVFCRVRPLNKRELALNDIIVVEATSEMDVNVISSKGEKNDFSYDSIFIEKCTQDDVFGECKSLIQSAFDGYNITIFTYGQTGAGKTWTLYGIPDQPGVSPRTCIEVFDVIKDQADRFECSVTASMVELYNSKCRDLLSKENNPPQLDIKQEKLADGSMAVKIDATVVPAENVARLEAAVAKGFGNRKVASTSMNADSSRSHLLFMIFLKVKIHETGKEFVGKITIVDLAGSERLAKSQVTGDAQKEAIEINKSLTALGDVMGAITSKAKMIPYRNHKLTQLMQDSLGGTAKTLMFVNISPASNNADETINALKYASRARSIISDSGPKSKAKAKGKSKASQIGG